MQKVFSLVIIIFIINAFSNVLEYAFIFAVMNDLKSQKHFIHSLLNKGVDLRILINNFNAVISFDIRNYKKSLKKVLGRFDRYRYFTFGSTSLRSYHQVIRPFLYLNFVSSL